VDGRGLLVGSPIQEIEEAEGIAGMNLEGKTIATALHLCCCRKRMTRVKKRHIVEATSEQYLSLQQEIESRTDFALPLHPEPSHQRRMPSCTSHSDIRQPTSEGLDPSAIENRPPGLPQSMPNIAFLDFLKSKLNSGFASWISSKQTDLLNIVLEGWANLLLNHDRHRDLRRPGKGLLLALPEASNWACHFTYCAIFYLCVHVVHVPGA